MAENIEILDEEQEITGQTSFFRWMFYSSIFLVLIFAAGYFFKIKASFNHHSEIMLPSVNFTPQELIEKPEIRLAHLQRRVTGASFYLYKVKMRDNLWKIASRKGYSVHSIIGCNPQLQTYDVSFNQIIMLPSRGGTLHTVQPNDTWQAIAERYKYSKEKIMSTNSNVDKLVPGEMIFIPEKHPDMALMNENMREKYELRALFTSPLGGRLTSLFGRRVHPVTGVPSFHGGIDIAVKNNTWVGAAADGIVIVAGDGIGHYGKAVFIEHENGYVTHYGHLSRIYVRQGQKVKARQLIAKSGSTGRVTGPHLHFTIKKNDVSKDPLKFIW